ncbi:MAG: photosystem I reaction center subunit XII [Oscillatoriales cyanobacterium RM2_1_1]|nr:photosystem I reaction center subunit XII [Oscillatoriales cyanobacterium SM2_3_0]NJO46002.1 photosystem I reaction center subunit XII [Oscillatoriales cyanobacterium RM2_1_1]
MVSHRSANVLGIAPLIESPPATLPDSASETQINAVITAAYRQVFGNVYLMKSERLIYAESLLRRGSIKVRGFIQTLGLSELYRQKFFYSVPQMRFVELNCKHFLGRAPYDQQEVAAHIQLFNQKGYEAEIKSYLDSEEYQATFSDTTVPYYRGFFTYTGQKSSGFSRMFRLYRGFANSDRAQLGGQSSRLIQELGDNAVSAVVEASGKQEGWLYRSAEKSTHAAAGNQDYSTDPIYRIEVVQTNPQAANPKRVWLIPALELSSALQRIANLGGKVISIALTSSPD